MNKLAILAALAVALPAFAQNGGPLRASLIGYQEVPAVSTNAMGEFEARVSADRQSVDYTLAFDGLQADVLMAHIHFAQKSVNGPIIVWLCGTTANQVRPARRLARDDPVSCGEHSLRPTCSPRHPRSS
jgi:hypothetical protein